MSELLDSHEISTNLGTDENFSLNNSNNGNYDQNLEEEIEDFIKFKGKNIGEEKGIITAKSNSTKENRLLGQTNKNTSKSHRGNINNMLRNKK